MSLAARLSALPVRLRPADLLLVGVVVAIVALLILPLPPVLIDVAVAVSITTGIMLLLTMFYIRTPLDFSTFPSVLLLSTLFRLSLSIATTRLILTEAEAGHIIQQFGEMVAGGNLIVGLVVFLIITIVQFVVISKGAERVAEVAARFSLDAMPGKQLSIDSDLRSGLTDKDEARAKRRTLELESKLHGSLDGAMKFVKGDAIASIIIVLVNLLGGFAIGVFSHGMELGEAITTYSILTIGDGLVAQVPALFSAMAAGLLVTRTTDEERDGDLGPAIARQVTGKPRVLFIAAGLCLLMALIPGFPAGVFVCLSLTLAAMGAWQHPVTRGLIDTRLKRFDKRPEPVPARVQVKPAVLAAVRPLVLEFSAPGITAVGANRLHAAIAEMIERLQARTGLQLPALDIDVVPADDRTQGRWGLFAYDAPVASGILADANREAELCAELSNALRRNLGLFLGLQEVTLLLNRIGQDYPDLVKEVVRAASTPRIAEVLRLLAEEEVPLRNMRDVLEAIADAGQSERNALPLADMTRVALRRYIASPSGESGRMRVLVVGSALERFLRSQLQTIDNAPRLVMPPDMARQMIAMLQSEAKASQASAIVTTFDLDRKSVV